MMSTNNATPKIVIALYTDWIEIIRGLLKQGGYALDPKDDPFKVAIKYFNVRLREIEAKPRTVHKAHNLTANPKWDKALAEIERKAACGQSLMPHLSKRLLDVNYNDPMLNDWGLHHLHLSTKIGPNGFTDRTGPLLFARVLPDAFYMVAVHEHGAWTNRQLLEEVLKNWPQLLAPYELKGVVGLGHNVTEKEHAQLRKYNIETCLQLSDNKAYTSMGGGVASDGTNADIVMRIIMFSKHLARIEDYIGAAEKVIYSLIYRR